MSKRLLCGRFELSLERPLIMGIVNVTPDSFSEPGSSEVDIGAAVEHAHRLIGQGADIIDIGGESTRPGSEPVSQDEELARVVPVIQALRDAGCPVSVDTSKLLVMRQALEAGADMINDITGFRDPEVVNS